jgi:hypothetical protein
VQAPRGAQPSGTNRSSSSSPTGRLGPGSDLAGTRLCRPRCAALRARAPREQVRTLNARRRPATVAGVAHPVPFRTRKLSPRAPMVLRGKPVGEQGVAGPRRAFGPGGGPGAFSKAPGPPSLSAGPLWRFRGAPPRRRPAPGGGVYWFLARPHGPRRTLKTGYCDR